MLQPLADDADQLRLGDLHAAMDVVLGGDRHHRDHLVIVARRGIGRPVEAFHPLRLRAAGAEGAGDIVGDVLPAHRDRAQADQHATGEQRDVGDPRPQLDQRDAKLALLVGQAGKAGRDRRGDDRLDLEMRRADAQIEVADRRPVGGDDMDVHAESIRMQPERLLDAGEPVERVERGLGVEHHPPLRIDRVAPGSEQRVDILLFDAMAAQLELDLGDVADQAAGGEADPDVLDVDAGDPLGLFHRLAHRRLGRRHVGDIAALDAAALALAGAEHDQLAAVALLRDHRRDLRRPDVERRDQSFRCNLRH